MNGEGIQHLTKEERKTIEIGGNKTCIFDYKCFEPSIAYTLNGVKMPEDPYSITLDGYDNKTLREIAKKCFLVMLNIQESNRDSLRSACNAVIAEDFNIANLHEKGLVPERVDVIKICDLLDEKNYHIREYFYGNAPVQLMYMGSLIDDYITDYFSQRKILVLSVFDEFIIEDKYKDMLQDVMYRAYEIVLGSSMNCKVVEES
jgi:hypothetical protein